MCAGWIAGHVRDVRRRWSQLLADMQRMAPAPPPRDEPQERGEPGPAGWLIPHPASVPAQHRILVPEHQQLGVLRLVAAEHPDSQAKSPAHEQAGDLEQHPGQPAITVSGLQPKQLRPRDRVFGRHRIGNCRRELLDRTLIWNQRHLMTVLREYEDFYNTHRPHRAP
jgi:hypothetical protein